MSALFYEDFETGQILESHPHTMTKDAIVAFAREFDPQPQHLDEAEAQHSVFGRLVASGWHTASISMRLQLDAGLARISGGALGARIDNLVFHKPVYPGDVIRTAVEVTDRRESRSKAALGLLTLHTRTTNQGGDCVMEMTATVFAPKRSITRPPDA